MRGRRRRLARGVAKSEQSRSPRPDLLERGLEFLKKFDYFTPFAMILPTLLAFLPPCLGRVVLFF